MESQETVALIGPWRAHVKKSPKVKPSWTRWLLLAPGASVDWLCLGPEGSGVASRLQSLVPSQALESRSVPGIGASRGNLDKELAKQCISW